MCLFDFMLWSGSPPRPLEVFFRWVLFCGGFCMLFTSLRASAEFFPRLVLSGLSQVFSGSARIVRHCKDSRSRRVCSYPLFGPQDTR